jgi:hypothetical protein
MKQQPRGRSTTEFKVEAVKLVRPYTISPARQAWQTQGRWS